MDLFENLTNLFMGGVPALAAGLLAFMVAARGWVVPAIVVGLIGLVVSWVWLMLPGLPRDAGQYYFGIVTSYASAFVVSLMFLIGGLLVPFIVNNASGPAEFFGKVLAWVFLTAVFGALAYFGLLNVAALDVRSGGFISEFLGLGIVVVLLVLVFKNASIKQMLGFGRPQGGGGHHS